jgi:hypothetical protein
MSSGGKDHRDMLKTRRRERRRRSPRWRVRSESGRTTPPDGEAHPQADAENQAGEECRPG